MEDSMKDFLNPKSALTIGGSSAMVLAFTTTLCNAFLWPAALVALSLSALFAIIQVTTMDEVKKWWMRPLYGIICTLVIFHAARGGTRTLAEGERAFSSPRIMAEAAVGSMNGAEEAAPSAALAGLPRAPRGAGIARCECHGRYPRTGSAHRVGPYARGYREGCRGRPQGGARDNRVS